MESEEEGKHRLCYATLDSLRSPPMNPQTHKGYCPALLNNAKGLEGTLVGRGLQSAPTSWLPVGRGPCQGIALTRQDVSSSSVKRLVADIVTSSAESTSPGFILS